MRVIGLLGGMSWESTAEYYRRINQEVAVRLGGLHSAQLLLHSVDFARVAAMQQRGEWEAAGTALAEAASGLEGAGAEAIVLCTNTMHRVAPAIEAALRIPMLHIADPTGRALSAAGVRTAGVLGTRYTMEQPFWRERLAERFGVDLLVPPAEEREAVHRIIYEELCRGVVDRGSREAYVRIIAGLARSGAEAVVFGCTEIGLLLGAAESPLPVYDTTALHATAAVDFMLDPADSFSSSPPGRPSHTPAAQGGPGRGQPMIGIADWSGMSHSTSSSSTQA